MEMEQQKGVWCGYKNLYNTANAKISYIKIMHSSTNMKNPGIGLDIVSGMIVCFNHVITISHRNKCPQESLQYPWLVCGESHSASIPMWIPGRRTMSTSTTTSSSYRRHCTGPTASITKWAPQGGGSWSPGQSGATHSTSVLGKWRDIFIIS